MGRKRNNKITFATTGNPFLHTNFSTFPQTNYPINWAPLVIWLYYALLYSKVYVCIVHFLNGVRRVQKTKQYNVRTTSREIWFSYNSKSFLFCLVIKLCRKLVWPKTLLIALWIDETIEVLIIWSPSSMTMILLGEKLV